MLLTRLLKTPILHLYVHKGSNTRSLFLHTRSKPPTCFADESSGLIVKECTRGIQFFEIQDCEYIFEEIYFHFSVTWSVGC